MLLFGQVVVNRRVDEEFAKQKKALERAELIRVDREDGESGLGELDEPVESVHGFGRPEGSDGECDVGRVGREEVEIFEQVVGVEHVGPGVVGQDVVVGGPA